MATPIAFRDRWTLVTGASSGLGAEIARVLAREHGSKLVLTARRRENLEALARELSPVECVVLPADLSRAGEAERLFADATRGRSIHAAVLNAGVTYYGPALELPTDRAEALFRTNALAPVTLARLLHPHMVAAGSGGGILVVGSVGGMFPMPWQADYGGTKAFLNSWGQAFAHETRGSGVSVTTFVPGGIATEMITKTNLSRIAKPGDLGIMPADRCARCALDALQKRRVLAVPGFVNNLTLLIARLLPRVAFLRGTATIYEKGLRR